MIFSILVSVMTKLESSKHLYNSLEDEFSFEQFSGQKYSFKLLQKKSRKQCIHQWMFAVCRLPFGVYCALELSHCQCMRACVLVYWLRCFLVMPCRLYTTSHGFRVIKMICRANGSLDTIFLSHHKTITVNQSGRHSLVFEQYSKRSHVSLPYIPFLISSWLLCFCFIVFCVSRTPKYNIHANILKQKFVTQIPHNVLSLSLLILCKSIENSYPS